MGDDPRDRRAYGRGEDIRNPPVSRHGQPQTIQGYAPESGYQIGQAPAGYYDTNSQPRILAESGSTPPPIMGRVAQPTYPIGYPTPSQSLPSSASSVYRDPVSGRTVVLNPANFSEAAHRSRR